MPLSYIWNSELDNINGLEDLYTMVEVISVVGNNRLGGMDFDDLIYEWIVKKTAELVDKPCDVFSRMEKHQMRSEAIRAKLVLSSEESVMIVIQNQNCRAL